MLLKVAARSDPLCGVAKKKIVLPSVLAGGDLEGLSLKGGFAMVLKQAILQECPKTLNFPNMAKSGRKSYLLNAVGNVNKRMVLPRKNQGLQQINTTSARICERNYLFDDYTSHAMPDKNYGSFTSPFDN